LTPIAAGFLTQADARFFNCVENKIGLITPQLFTQAKDSFFRVDRRGFFCIG
jgi:hypothetical protein